MRVKKFPVPSIKLLDRPGDRFADSYGTIIAGVRYRCDETDEGGFTGFIVPDPDNEADSRAMAVCSFDRLLGYIPEKDLDEFITWCDGKPVPCVGYIFVDDGTGDVRGRVKAFLPCNAKFLRDEFSRYIQWLNDERGEEFVPDDLTICVDNEDGTPAGTPSAKKAFASLKSSAEINEEIFGGGGERRRSPARSPAAQTSPDDDVVRRAAQYIEEDYKNTPFGCLIVVIILLISIILYLI